MAFDPFTAIFDLGGKIIDRLIPDKAKQAEARAQLVQMQLQGELQQFSDQLAVNKVEAASNSVFVAGWRPYVGWICGTGIAVDVIVRPLVIFFSAAFGHPLNLPALDLTTLLPLLGGMLGFGAMRSYDKYQSTDNGH